MKRVPKKSVLHDKRYHLLLQDLKQTEHDLDAAYTKLGSVLEQDLIDCYIYEVQSLQMRYRFLLKRIKQIEDSYAKNPLEASGS